MSRQTADSHTHKAAWRSDPMDGLMSTVGNKLKSELEESGYMVLVIAGDPEEQQEILVNVRALGYEARVA